MKKEYIDTFLNELRSDEDNYGSDEIDFSLLDNISAGGVSNDYIMSSSVMPPQNELEEVFNSYALSSPIKLPNKRMEML